jgi:hypothetical protein
MTGNTKLKRIGVFHEGIESSPNDNPKNNTN